MRAADSGGRHHKRTLALPGTPLCHWFLHRATQVVLAITVFIRCREVACSGPLEATWQDYPAGRVL